MVHHTAINAAPFVAEEPIDTENLEILLMRTKNTQPDVSAIYCANNIPWSKGGYIYFYPHYIPPADYDQTQRSWFIQLKAHQLISLFDANQAVYIDPYFDIRTGNLVVTPATVLFDAAGRDIGALAADIDVAFLEDILLEMSSLPNQQTYFLNKDGLFITHPDLQAVLKKDFFTETNLERYRADVLSTYSFFKVDKEVFICSVHIPEVSWTLVSIIPTEAIYQQINRFLYQMIGVNILLVIIAAAGAVILIGILQNERDENAAMKDNLKVGFFLMDKQYLIQGQYSTALEKLFSVNDLRGKNFINILSDSLNKKEIETLKDYFDMIVNRSFDKELLDDINPIQELNYVSVETGDRKTLNCGFTSVSRGRKDVYILGNILDITAEKELKTRLAEEAAGREEDMHFLFEVIQGDPGVLHDFIDDMDYGFDQIDEILADKRLAPKDASVNIYQAIHAIKSNAVILGLKTFGDKLHDLETEIKTVQEQEAVFKDDLQRLSGAIKKVKQNRKKLAGALQKIESFKSAGKRKQGEYVLVESLSRACAKVAEDLHKQVEFRVESIDPEVIEKGPRRMMKDTLMQLVRNAVYHGIEPPEERLAKGKPETGGIVLNISREPGLIEIRLKDDGKGLNYPKIKAKAERLGLISPSESDDRDALVQTLFAPGFSTAESADMHAGRGIGLNLVKDRVEELKGKIAVHSQPNAGTEFIISIPYKI
jgi:two-component system chemotaxis sensor kinase CheA